MSTDFKLDPETGTFVPSAEAMERAFENPRPLDEQVPLDDFIPSDDDDVMEYIPGGSGSDNLQPPETFYILEQNVITHPDGSTTVDVIIEVEDDTESFEYEVRVTK